MGIDVFEKTIAKEIVLIKSELIVRNPLVDEIVVIGYGTVKKKDLTGSVSVVSDEDFNKGNITSAQELLVGKTAGVVITTNSGAPGSGSTIRIRGGSSLNASNEPLIIIDGVPLDRRNVGGSANLLSAINPNDIENVTILKDASSTAIYGARASNGVIIITTKKGQAGKPLVLSYNGYTSISTPTKFVDVYTGGFDKDQFLKDKVRKLPEYSQSKKAARELNVQSLASTALANGLSLDKNFGADVITGWVKRIEAGEDIDIFKNLIRKTAAVGLPENLVKLVDSGVDLDTIYAPYKRTMANILEVPESTITLDDPVLRGAIGPDKPMTLFDFQKQLRKDARWQYTDQAKEEVSSAALKVLRDFGFQG